MKKIFLLTIASILLIGGAWLIKSSMINPQVAQLEAIPVDSCISNVLSFTTTETCAPGKVKRADYVCVDQSKLGYEGGGANDCIDPLVAFDHASAYCGKICTAQLQSPLPSPPINPYPSPSVLVSPDIIAKPISCKLKVYKRPAGMDGWSESQIINPLGASINSGEQLAYAVELVNLSKSAVSGRLKLSTNNLSGEKEPVNVKSFGGLCTLSSGGRSMSCNEEVFNIDQSTTKGLPSMTIVFEVLSPKVTGIEKTGITFSGSLGLYDFTCEPTTNIKINYTAVSPTTTPTAISTTIPTSTPQASPTPAPTAISACAKQLESWAYRKSCGTGSYRFLDFKCQGDTTLRTIGSTNSCKSSSTWLSEAKKLCLNTSCPSPTPTPRPTVTPVRRGCYSLFGRRICIPEFRPTS